MGAKAESLFYYFHFERNYDLLKLKNSCPTQVSYKSGRRGPC